MRNLKLNPKDFGFTKWILEIDFFCDEFYLNLTPDEEESTFVRGEESFWNGIANITPEIAKYYQ